MFGRESINRYEGGDGYDLRVNSLHEELRRLGKWRAMAPLRLQSSSTGFVLSLENYGKAAWKFKNMSSSVCPSGGVVKITGPLDSNTLYGYQPDTTWGPYYAVATSDVGPNEYGPCEFYSPDAVTVKFQSGGGTTVGPRPNQWEAAFGYPGFLYLGIPPSISGQYCKALQMYDTTIVGITTTTVTPAGGVVELCIPYAYSWQQTGMTLTCVNWLLGATGQQIAVGRRVVCQKVYDSWIVTQAECG